MFVVGGQRFSGQCSKMLCNVHGPKPFKISHGPMQFEAWGQQFLHQASERTQDSRGHIHKQSEFDNTDSAYTFYLLQKWSAS